MPARKSRRHAGVRPSSNRRAAWLAGLISLPVMVIVAFFLVEALGPQRAQTTTSAGADPAARRCAATATAGSVPCAQPLVAASTVSPSAPAASTSPPASAVPSASPSATRAPSPPSHPAAPAAPPAGPAGGQQGVPAGQVLAVINQARAAAGLPAYPISSGLDLSATRHNRVMASGCGLSHQCPGEAALGARETAAGVTWTAAGENIGEGGPVPAASTAIAQMAVTLTRDMLAEKPPDNGHRLNILSSAFHHIGIAVYRDSAGTVWMTQDFSN